MSDPKRPTASRPLSLSATAVADAAMSEAIDAANAKVNASLREHAEQRDNKAAWSEVVLGRILSALADDDDEQVYRWQDDAVCAQTDPEIFYPERGGSTREAKAVCQGCPVREQCLEEAVANDERFGIWGGLSERERRKIKIARRGTPRRDGRGWSYPDEESEAFG